MCERRHTVRPTSCPPEVGGRTPPPPHRTYGRSARASCWSPGRGIRNSPTTTSRRGSRPSCPVAAGAAAGPLRHRRATSVSGRGPGRHCFCAQPPWGQRVALRARAPFARHAGEPVSQFARRLELHTPDPFAVGGRPGPSGGTTGAGARRSRGRGPRPGSSVPECRALGRPAPVPNLISGSVVRSHLRQGRHKIGRDRSSQSGDRVPASAGAVPGD